MALFGKSKQPKEQGFNAVLAAMKHDYEAGKFQKVYQVRERYGFSIGDTESGMDRPTWFWFNAYGALGGLKSGHSLGGLLATACGYASASVDWANTEETAANAEIEKLAFG